MSRPLATRANVLGFRARRQGLEVRPGDVDAVMGLGLQDTPAGSAARARRLRTGGGPAPDELIVWSWRASPPPRGVRLLGPGDPWLSARDRDVVVPDVARQRAVWKVLGNPGVVLVDGEVRGTWRAKQSASMLTVTVSAFESLTPSTVAAVEADAQTVAAGRGVGEARVVVG